MKLLVDQLEEERLKEVHKFILTERVCEKKLQELVEFAALSFKVPMIYISLIDDFVQKIKASKGIFLTEMRREDTFCHHVLQTGTPLVIHNTTSDPRFRENPLVVRYPHIRFYAGAPLISKNGYNLGVFCICDSRFRTLHPDEINKLELFSRLAVNLMETNLLIRENKTYGNYPDVLENELSALKEQNLRLLYQISRGITEPRSNDQGQMKVLPSGQVTGKFQQSNHTAYMDSKTLPVNFQNTMLSEWNHILLENFKSSTYTVPVSLLFKQLSGEMDELLTHRGNRVTLDIGENVKYYGNEGAMKFVFNNLLSYINKRAEHGHIHIKSHQDSDYTVVVMEYKGNPLLRAEMDRIVRSIPVSEDPSGNLELFYSWQTIKLIGGFMTVPDDESQGYYITLGLPGKGGNHQYEKHN